MKNLLLSLTLITCTGVLIGMSSTDVHREQLEENEKTRVHALVSEATNPHETEEEKKDAISRLRELLEKDPELINEKNQYGITPLMILFDPDADRDVQRIIATANIKNTIRRNEARSRDLDRTLKHLLESLLHES